MKGRSGFNWRKHLALPMTSLMLAASMVSGCGGTQEADSQPQNGGGSSDPTDISIMTIFYSPEPPGPDNVIVKEVEKRTNTKLKITWVSPNNYEDKQNVTLASGDIPDLMFVVDPFKPQVRQMVQQGAFWDLTDLIKDYPNLMKYPKETWINTKMEDGKNYGIPRVRPVEGGGFPNVRKDWLDNLKMDLPKTIDDYYKMMQAFTNNDPDGNGKKDTIGLSGYVTQDGMGSLGWVENVFAGSNGKWKDQNGKLIDTTLEPSERDALVWLNKAFKEGLIPADFAVLKHDQARALWESGKAGSFSDTPQQAWVATEQQLKTNPKADNIPLVSLSGPNGEYVNRDSGFFGMFAIPKTVPEDKVKKLLAFMDYGSSDEGSDLANYGIEGVHYKKQDDGIIVATEQAKKDNVSQQAFGQIFLKYEKYMRAYKTGITPEAYKRNIKIIDERAKVSIPSPATGLYSETALQVGPEYDKKTQDLKTQVIMGKQPIEAWDKYVETLKSDAKYQQIIKEMNDAYQKRSGK